MTTPEDHEADSAEPTPGEEEHLTGDRQAAINREDDPPS
jgi:hypothetical protein